MPNIIIEDYTCFQQPRSIVVPAIIDKIPESVRLSIARGRQYDKWKIDEMLKELLSEL